MIPNPPGQPPSDPEDYQLACRQVARMAAEQHALVQATGVLAIWVQFNERTLDNPGMHVARLWGGDANTGILVRAGSAEELAGLLPPGLAFVPRLPGDDPNIVGVWLSLGRLTHMAHRVSPTGGVSALCYQRPQPIDLARAGWTLLPQGVTCPRCLAVLREADPAPAE